MPTLRDFAVASCQATLFTPDAAVAAAKLLSRLLPRWVTRFDGEPTVLPVPDGLPREVPRVILQSSSGQWRCEVASGRINIVRRVTELDGPSLDVARFHADVTPMLLEYSDFVDSRIGRLASVISRFTMDPAPARTLAAHFCQERWLAAPLNRPASFELHAHKVFLLAGVFQVNSWVRNKSGTLSDGKGERAIILAEQDLNTLVEEAGTRSFTKDEVASFFRVASDGFDEALSLYYPDQG